MYKYDCRSFIRDLYGLATDRPGLNVPSIPSSGELTDGRGVRGYSCRRAGARKPRLHAHIAPDFLSKNLYAIQAVLGASSLIAMSVLNRI